MTVAEIAREKTIDVVIPVYNGEKFIGQALSSVLAQTRKPDTIIVVDDGSTDKTADTIRSRLSEGPIRYIRKPNGGPSSARNIGIAEGSGMYVTFLDADDVWESTKLEKQASMFEHSRLNNLGVVHCGIVFIDADGEPKKKFGVSPLAKDARGQISGKLSRSNCIVGSASSVMIRRECFAAAGLFDESLRTAEDWDMWLRIAEHYDYDFVDEPLVHIRRHSENSSSDADRMVVGRILVLSKLAKNSTNRLVVLQELRYQVLHLLIRRRLRMVPPNLEEYMDAATIENVFSDRLGMFLALCRAAGRTGKKFIEKIRFDCGKAAGPRYR